MEWNCMQMIWADANATGCQLQEHFDVFSMGRTKQYHPPTTHSTVEKHLISHKYSLTSNSVKTHKTDIQVICSGLVEERLLYTNKRIPFLVNWSPLFGKLESFGDWSNGEFFLIFLVNHDSSTPCVLEATVLFLLAFCLPYILRYFLVLVKFLLFCNLA